MTLVPHQKEAILAKMMKRINFKKMSQDNNFNKHKSKDLRK